MCMNGGNLNQTWKFWKQKFTMYLKATEIIKKDDSTKCAQLLTLIGDEGIRIYNTFTYTNGQNETLEVLLKKFDDHFNPKANLTFERYKFLTCRQKEGQTIEQFITELKNLSLSCELEELRESLVRDLLVCGLKSDQLRAQLFDKDCKTLEDAVNFCINSESTKEQNRQISNGNGDNYGRQINVVHSKLRNNNPAKASPSHSNWTPNPNNQGCKKCRMIDMTVGNVANLNRH
jgi:hypothetical protein